MAFLGFALVVLIFAFWLVMLIDALTTQKLEPAQRALWALVIFFFPVVGAVLYFVLTPRTGSED